MKKIFYVAMIALLCGAVVSCGSAPSTADSLTAAERALETHHYKAAQTVADELYAETAKGSFTATELGRLSLLFMRLSENGGEHENIGQAMQCYLKAYETDPDSARAFYDSLPLDESSYVDMMSTLGRSITTPTVIAGEDSWGETRDSLELVDGIYGDDDVR